MIIANEPSKSNPSGPPSFELFIGDAVQSQASLDQLSAAAWQSLQEKILDADGPAVLAITKLPAWPAEARQLLFGFVTQLHAKLRVDGEEFSDPFEASLAAMVGLDNIAAHCGGLECAIQAAAHCYPADPETTAAKINSRLADLGAPRRNFRSLASQIKKAACQEDGEGDNKPSAEPSDMAVAYLEDLRKRHGMEDDELPLWFFQHDFYEWNGKRWEQIEALRFTAMVTAFLQEKGGKNLNERYVRDVVCNLRGRTLLNCWNESMPFYMKDEKPLTVEQRHLIVFGNGMIDMDQAIAKPKVKPKLLDFDSRYFNEIVLPYDFAPDAQCPLWLQTIKEILPKKSKLDKRRMVLQEFMGYTLLLICKFAKFLVLIGSGGNGKSTITEIWQAMLGDENVSAVGLESLGDEFRQWPLKGKLANFSGELPYLNKVNEGTLKRIVSGEPVDANRKNRDPVKLRLHAKLIVNTNDMPRINDATPATWDRMIVIPFLERFRDTDKDDKDRVEKLRDELPGIFLWSLAGLRRLLQNGKFTECALCKSKVQEHRIESDSVLAFLDECCEKSKGHVVFSQRLYHLYRHYCTETGRTKPFGESEFGKRMIRAGHEKKRGKIAYDPARRPVYRDVDLSEDGLKYWKAIRHRFVKFQDDDEGPAEIGYQETHE
jgi:P4 family phage/plasmid primase-like protien